MTLKPMLKSDNAGRRHQCCNQQHYADSHEHVVEAADQPEFLVIRISLQLDRWPFSISML